MNEKVHQSINQSISTDLLVVVEEQHNKDVYHSLNQSITHSLNQLKNKIEC
jgi:hypothetical protein